MQKGASRGDECEAAGDVGSDTAAGMQTCLGPGHGRACWACAGLCPSPSRASTCRALRELAAADRRHLPTTVSHPRPTNDGPPSSERRRSSNVHPWHRREQTLRCCWCHASQASDRADQGAAAPAPATAAMSGRRGQASALQAHCQYLAPRQSPPSSLRPACPPQTSL